MKLSATFLSLAAALAASPALAHPGHGLSGHVHWEYVAVGAAVVAAALVWRARKAG